MVGDRLRVVHIITQLELGGAQQNTLYTVAHLNDSLYEPVLITGPGGLLDDEATKSIPVLRVVPKLVRPIHPIYDVWATIALYKLLRDLKPHIVHTHSSKAGILGRIAAYVAGVPVIIHTFHGFGFTPGQKILVRSLFLYAERFCAMLSTHLIFVSAHNRIEAQLLKIGPRTPASLIRSGIAMTPSLKPSGNVRRELNLPGNAWLVISVGNFKPQKNPLDLIEVASLVRTKDPSIHFLLVGDGPLRKKAESLARQKGLTDRVHFLGWRRDVADLLADSQAFLLTSLWEGLPRALVESSLAGLPAVAYAVNGVNDILVEGKTGFPVAPHDVARAAEKILWLRANPPEAKLLGTRARQAVRQEFDIDWMVRQQEALYDELYAAVPLKDYYRPSCPPQT